MHAAALYLILCLIAGIAGRHTRIKFMGCFLAAVLLTPIPTFIFIMLFGSKPQLEPVKIGP